MNKESRRRSNKRIGVKYRRGYAATPNKLIDDAVMQATSKIVFHAMSLSQGKGGLVKLTVEELVRLSGLCEETVLQALRELEACGFIRKKRCWRWSKTLDCPVYAANTYKLCRDFSEGYTLLSAKIMYLEITPKEFCILMKQYRCAGREGRAYPSIRYIAGAGKKYADKGLKIAISTVCRALKRLQELGAIVKLECETRAGDNSCNSYYMTAMVGEKASSGKPACPEDSGIPGENFFAEPGVPIFREASPNNKITGVYT